jgi:hypothetical protein
MDTYAGIAAIISAMTALVAVFVGPVMTARIQRRGRLSGMRETWINDLRKTLSSVVSHAEACAAMLVQSREINEDFKRTYDFLVQLEGKAKMMLNPKESDHRRLQEKLEQIVALVNDQTIQSAAKMDKTRTLTTEMIPIAQAVFKEAWDKAK